MLYNYAALHHIISILYIISNILTKQKLQSIFYVQSIISQSIINSLVYYFFSVLIHFYNEL